MNFTRESDQNTCLPALISDCSSLSIPPLVLIIYFATVVIFSVGGFYAGYFYRAHLVEEASVQVVSRLADGLGDDSRLSSLDERVKDTEVIAARLDRQVASITAALWAEGFFDSVRVHRAQKKENGKNR